MASSTSFQAQAAHFRFSRFRIYRGVASLGDQIGRRATRRGTWRRTLPSCRIVARAAADKARGEVAVAHSRQSAQCPLVAVRPEGANYQWRKISTRRIVD